MGLVMLFLKVMMITQDNSSSCKPIPQNKKGNYELFFVCTRPLVMTLTFAFETSFVTFARFVIQYLVKGGVPISKM